MDTRLIDELVSFNFLILGDFLGWRRRENPGGGWRPFGRRGGLAATVLAGVVLLLDDDGYFDATMLRLEQVTDDVKRCERVRRNTDRELGAVDRAVDGGRRHVF